MIEVVATHAGGNHNNPIAVLIQNGLATPTVLNLFGLPVLSLR